MFIIKILNDKGELYKVIQLRHKEVFDMKNLELITEIFYPELIENGYKIVIELEE